MRFSLLLLFVLAGCRNYSNLPPNSLQIPLEMNLKSLDPAFCSDLYESQVVPNIYEPLLQYSYLKRPLQVEPLLADGLPKVSADGLNVTIKIRKGVRFQDSEVFKDGQGREVVAADFIYSWKRLMDPKTASEGSWIFDGYVRGFNEWRDKIAKQMGKFDDPVSGLNAPDERTIAIKLTKPYYQLNFVLAIAYASVVPREAVEHYGPQFLNHPVGTGPFRLENWLHGNRITLARNPTYHEDRYPTEGEAGDAAAGLLEDRGKRLPFLDKISFWEMPEEQPRWLNFMKGVFDWARIPKDNFDAAVEKGKLKERLAGRGIQLATAPELDLTYTGINMEDPLLGKNLNLRRALSLAYDRDVSLDKFYNGRGVIAQSPIPPGMDGYDPNFKNPWVKFNLAKAKEYLARAGYPEGKGLPTLDLSMANNGVNRQLGEYAQQQWAAIGVKTNINMNSWPQFQERLRTRKVQMNNGAWQADYPDPQNMFQILYGKNVSPGPNEANFADPEFDKVYEDALKLPPGEKRMALYRKMRDLFVEKLPWLPNIHRFGYITYHGWIRNFKFNSTIQGVLKYIRVDEDAKKNLKGKL